MNPRLLQAAMGVVLGLMAASLFLMRTLSAPDGPDDTAGFLRSNGSPEGPGASAQAGFGGLLPDPVPAPMLELQAPDGRTVTLEDFRGDVVAVFFGYTNCPDVCPITLNRLGRLQEERGETEPDLRVLFVSVDPARDTPERLESYVGGLAGRVEAITGPVDVVRRQAFDFGVSVAERPMETLPQGEYLVDHSARTFIVGPEGRIVASLGPLPTVGVIDGTLEAVFRAVAGR